MVGSNETHLLKFFRHCFVYFPTVKLLQLFCDFQTDKFYTFHWHACSHLQQKITCENCKTRNEKRNFVRPKTSSSTGSLHLIFVPILQSKPEQKWNITFPKHTIWQLLELFINRKFRMKIFTAFSYCESVSGGTWSRNIIRSSKACCCTRIARRWALNPNPNPNTCP